MNRLHLPLATVDILAIVGVFLLAIGVGSRFGADIAIGLIGLVLLVYAVLASRSEVTP